MIPINPEAIGDPNETPVVYIGDAAAEVLGIPRRATYFGPCRAGLHPEFGWGKPCMNDAAEYVEIHTEGVEWSKTSLMRLCTEHADQAEKRDGFHSRRPLTVPYEPPMVTP